MNNFTLHVVTSKNNFTKEYLPSSDIASDLYNLVNEPIFVYIKKEDYNLLNPEVVVQIDENKFENTPQENKSIKEILNKKVLFIKYNNKEEIIQLTFLRKKATNNVSFIIMELNN